MDVEYIEGDLFDLDEVDAWGHGVNCVGVMGAGIALGFKHRFPDMYRQYVMECALGRLELGDVFPWAGDKVYPHVFNIASQRLPGANASLQGLQHGLTQAMVYTQRLATDNDPMMAVPRIGAGIGGLQWEDVKEVYESVSKHVPDVQLVVVTPPQP